MLNGYFTRHECAEKCINETKFLCRSANFRVKGRSLNVLTQNVTDTIGFCSLNDADRHTLPNSFRVSSYGAEYIENQCIDICKYPCKKKSKIFVLEAAQITYGPTV